MVRIIPPNLRSQETDKSVPHARAPPPPPDGPGSGRRGVAWQAVLQLPVSWRASCDPSPSASLCERLSRGEPLALGTREQNYFRVTAQPQVRVFPSRDSARTEQREGSCLRSPCRSRPCTGDRQLGFWGASTRLPKSSSSWRHDKGSWTRIWIIRAHGTV
jgi:hypothetical protein